jgi:uncharacterized protein YjbI with pentapeptide repeats
MALKYSKGPYNLRTFPLADFWYDDKLSGSTASDASLNNANFQQSQNAQQRCHDFTNALITRWNFNSAFP